MACRHRLQKTTCTMYCCLAASMNTHTELTWTEASFNPFNTKGASTLGSKAAKSQAYCNGSDPPTSSLEQLGGLQRSKGLPPEGS